LITRGTGLPSRSAGAWWNDGETLLVVLYDSPRDNVSELHVGGAGAYTLLIFMPCAYSFDATQKHDAFLICQVHECIVLVETVLKSTMRSEPAETQERIVLSETLLAQSTMCNSRMHCAY
jgi:hypothetical protein